MKKYALVIVALILLPSFLVAQDRPSQQIRRITVTNKYEIVDGKRTSKFRAIGQQFYDSLGNMHTTTKLNYETGEIESYTWNTYNDGKLMKTVAFLADKFQSKKTYTYNSNKQVDQEFVHNLVNTDTVVVRISKYEYTNNGKPSRIIVTDSKGKKLCTQTFTYDIKGQEVKRKVKAVKGFVTSDSIMELKNTPKYDSLGRLESERLLVKYFGGKQENKIYTYTYNPKGQNIKKVESDFNGNTTLIYTYRYNNSGRIIEQNKLNAKEQYIESLAFRYEIYRTADLRYREIEY
ncbi:MAG: hypothetical protein F9K37_09005 [Bacteroidales bacterium]|nr:MAG: hypothetical protein F9K37_09005 [Bacteroidales bacterium]